MTDDRALDDEIEPLATLEAIARSSPIYYDLLQPATKELGIALQTVARTVHVALAPLSALVWGYEETKAYLGAALAKRLASTPTERIITPNAAVAVPALQAFRYSGQNAELREMYANLLATAMDAATAREAHPAFVEITKQLSPDEARILTLFKVKRGWPITVPVTTSRRGIRSRGGIISDLAADAGCVHQDLEECYIDNLARLGLIRVHTDSEFVRKERYAALEAGPRVQEVLRINAWSRMEVTFERGVIEQTRLGELYYDACVADRDELRALHQQLFDIALRLALGLDETASGGLSDDGMWRLRAGNELICESRDVGGILRQLNLWAMKKRENVARPDEGHHDGPLP